MTGRSEMKSASVALSSLALLVLVGLSGGCSQERASTVSTQPAADSAGVKIAFTVDPDPPRAGDNKLVVSVSQGGAPLADAAVTAVFYMPAMPSMNMPEMRSTFPLQAVGEGVYRGEANLSMGGTWIVTVTASRAGQTLGSGKYTVIAR
jgi:nitrogen fixation protein FixH